MAPELKHTLLVGLNFKTAGVSVRERVSFAGDLLAATLERICSSGPSEAAILSTCNRVELYAVDEDVERGFRVMVDGICEAHGLERGEIEPHLYFKRCEEAVSHLYSVSASLDSMIVGEAQILAQVKKAYALAAANRSTGSVLNKLFQSAIQIGKKVRNETDIGQGSLSVGSVAVDLMREIFPEHSSFSLLLLGAGEVAELVAEQLKKYGNADIRVANRTLEKVEGKFGGRVVDFEKRHEEAAACDIVIVSTAAPDYVLDRSRLEQAMKARQSEVAFFVDLSVPRNIDPAIGEMDRVILYSIDDLEKVVQTNALKRSGEAVQARAVIEGSLGDFGMWYAKRRMAPFMQKLREHHAATRDAVLAGYGRQAGDFSTGQMEALLKITDKLIARQVDEIMLKLEQKGDPSRIDPTLNTLRDLYGLESE
ncbi:MAG: glutamyl-tRNA reductase [Planctomycetes bacterium]|nr:glutamyl-tRNA reductase [Planctomycetota bacterium]